MTTLSLLTTTVFLCVGSFSNVASADGSSAASSQTKTKQAAESEQPATKTTRIPIYITPFYNSKGPQINTGAYSKDTGAYSKELTAATADSITELTKKMKKKWAILPVETMYITSIRLYDLGHKNEAVYWFYSAQMRARLFRSLLPKESIRGIGSEGFERFHAHNSFYQLAGKYINGYAFGQLDSLKKTLRLVKSESKTLPKFNTIYPKLKFIDAESWPKNNEDIAAGLDKLVDYIVKNTDKIKAARKKNGIEGKY